MCVCVCCTQDAKKTSHRGFGFVTFSDEGAAERVALRTHEILGHQVSCSLHSSVAILKCIFLERNFPCQSHEKI